MESNNPDPRPRVLVVDDHPASLLAMEAELDRLGASVTRAASGEAALTLAHAAEFALILLDVHLPDMSGIDVARRLRSSRRTAETPIIFVTAYDQDDRDVLAAYALGAVDFLFKPLRLEVLRAKARVFINLSDQAEQIREHERREHARALEAARHAWEEESLRRERDQLTEIDRRKERFLAMVGHELRTPLAPLVTALELMKQRLEQEPSANDWLLRTRDSMERQVEHLSRLVDDLLDVARINSDKLHLRMAKVRMRDIVEQAVATSRPLIDEKEHTFVVELSEEPLAVEGDRVRLVQIIANLLNNAARYTPHRGTLRLSCGRAGDHVEVRVSDNGQGMSEEALSRAFEAFMQGERGHAGGLGLGLAIVQRLVALHGGTVSAYSEGPGLGSEFVVCLPVAVPTPDTSESAPAASAHCAVSEQ
jgi:signal transduction histidine kinase